MGNEVHETADPITEDKFEELLEPGHLGRSTYTGTHLEFSPAPEHDHGSTDSEVEESEHENHEPTSAVEETDTQIINISNSLR